MGPKTKDVANGLWLLKRKKIERIQRMDTPTAVSGASSGTGRYRRHRGPIISAQRRVAPAEKHAFKRQIVNRNT